MAIIWQENGEVWQRLKVTFPESIASHSREQISCFRNIDFRTE
jgi:hypothetical protein